MTQVSTSWIIISVFIAVNIWLFSALGKHIAKYDATVESQQQKLFEELDV